MAASKQPCFSLRSRHEVGTRDQVNALHVELWQTDGPFLQNDRPDTHRQHQFQDMNPINSRTTERNYRQHPTYQGTATGFSQNPYFDKYDVTNDPRNACRELRATIYEERTDRGLLESKQLLERRFAKTTRWTQQLQERPAQSK